MFIQLTTRQKIALAQAARALVRGWRHATGRSRRGIFRRQGICYELDLDEGIDFSVYLFGCFEPCTVHRYRKLIQPGQTVLDIGANIGAHTLQFARLVSPWGQVYAFEPTAYAFSKLKQNVQLNRELSTCIELRRCFLAATAAEGPPPKVYSSWPLVGAGDERQRTHLGALKSTEGASVTSVDRFVAEAGLKRLDWIKLDVDGYEIDVLRGAGSALRFLRPKLIMELAPHCFGELGFDFGELVGLLQRHGYRMRELFSARELPLDAGFLLRRFPVGVVVNVLLTRG